MIYSEFNKKVGRIEDKTTDLIDKAFNNLRSSEGAFDLLQNFKNIAVRFYTDTSYLSPIDFRDYLRKDAEEILRGFETIQH